MGGHESKPADIGGLAKSPLDKKIEAAKRGEKTFKLVNYEVTDAGMKRIGEVLQMGSCCIEELSLQNISVTVQAFIELGKSIAKNKSLRHLSYSKNKITESVLRGGDDDSVEMLHGATMQVAETINIAEAFSGGPAALESMLRTHVSLESLSLDENTLDDAGAQAVGNALKVNRSLQKLRLVRNIIKEEGARALAAGLEVNESVTTLNLDDNSIGDGGCAVLMEMLKARPLQELNLRANSITTGSAASISSALEAQKGLAVLDLRRNCLMDEGVALLAEGLVKNGSVHTLRLCSNRIANMGCICLAEALEQNSKVRVLGLSVNNVQDEGCRRFAEMLKRNGTLEKVSFMMNEFTLLGYRSLKDALPGNESLKELKLCNNLVGSELLVSEIEQTLKGRSSDTQKQVEEEEEEEEGVSEREVKRVEAQTLAMQKAVQDHALRTQANASKSGA